MKPHFNDSQQAELASWKLWQHLSRLRQLEAASETVALTPEEADEVWQSFFRSRALNHGQPEAVPPEYEGLPPDELKSAVLRDARIEKWKEQTFGPSASDHFAKRRTLLDRVVYSVIRVEKPGLARELGFRLSEGEAEFAGLAREYSAGEERYTGGLLGPVALGSLHPALAKALHSAKPGVLLGPLQVAEWFVVARVEIHLPCELDGAMHQRMIDELAAVWMEKRAHGNTKH